MRSIELEISRNLPPLPPGTPARFFAGGKPAFTACGCALLERAKENGFVCAAANLAAGKTEATGRGLHRLEGGAFPAMAERMRQPGAAGRGRFEADRKPGESAAKKELAEILNHIFANILPEYGYAVRENQIGLAEHILESIARRGVSLAESEVGTGKTCAYLIAAALAKRGRLNDFWLRGHYPKQSYAAGAYMPAIIATSSIALQRALVKDFIPELSRILVGSGIIRTPLSCFIRKGKEHYLCERRLRAFMADADAGTKEALLPLAVPGAPCDLAEAEGLTAYMKQRICVAGKCGENCRYFSSCRYIEHLAEANGPAADFIVTNHNYLLADILHRANGKRPLLPHRQAVIIDEAHKLLPAARQMYGLALADSEIPKLAEAMHNFTEGKSAGGVNIHRLAKKLEGQSGRLFRTLNENAARIFGERGEGCGDEAERFPAAMGGECSRHLRNIAAISGELIEALAGSRVQARFREGLSRTVRELAELQALAASLRKHGGLVCWLERPGDGEQGDTILRAIPTDLDGRLFRDAWSKGIPAILTSGTLSAGGDFTRAKRALGIDRVSPMLLSETSKPSPFGYQSNALLYLSENVPFPDNADKRYIAAVADEIGRLVRVSHGHAAALFTSYNAMGIVFAELQRRSLPFPLFRMGRRDAGALERFKASGNGILFAAGALWEGIDIPGDALSMLIIVKLPFAAPDPIGDYEKMLYGGMDAYKAKALVPDMLVKLKQGAGRLIRTETDTGVIAILDSRARMSGAYHRQVLAALPPFRAAHGIGDIEKFMSDRKPPAYFA
ncbi:MAG: ATP-dependent DNA helicase [Clostridiales bacterium]|nr:ATP-dependent DNA helicase [Clostridiales bacterium]MDR1439334.1 ATP-dependent DNA helicase [Clostridiales bacterium]